MKDRGDGKQSLPLQVIGGDQPHESAAPTRRRRSLAVVFPLLIFVGLTLIIGLGIGQGGTATTTILADPLSEPEPITVDARTATDLLGGTEWQRAELEVTARLGNVLAIGSEFVATGYDIDGPALWRSDTGETWILTDRLSLPRSEPSVEWFGRTLRLIEWEGRSVVFGMLDNSTAVWIDAEFAGVVDSTEFWLVNTVVGGRQLLASFLQSTDPDSGWEQMETVWMISADGTDWDSISTTGLSVDDAHPIAWIDGNYYAASRCLSPDCSSTLSRSPDGVDWTRVAMELPDAGNALDTGVRGIAKVGAKLLAIGETSRDLDAKPTAWISSDGTEWSLFPLDDAFAPRYLSLEVESIGATRAGATISIDGVTYQDVPSGSVIETDIGPITLTAITSDSVIMAMESGLGSAHVGEVIQLTQRALIYDIAAAENQVAIVGRLNTSTDRGSAYGTPAVWLSADGGSTWTRTDLPDEIHWIDSMAVAGSHVALIGSETGTPRIWYRPFVSP